MAEAERDRDGYVIVPPPDASQFVPDPNIEMHRLRVMRFIAPEVRSKLMDEYHPPFSIDLKTGLTVALSQSTVRDTHGFVIQKTWADETGLPIAMSTIQWTRNILGFPVESVEMMGFYRNDGELHADQKRIAIQYSDPALQKSMVRDGRSWILDNAELLVLSLLAKKHQGDLITAKQEGSAFLDEIAPHMRSYREFGATDLVDYITVSDDPMLDWQDPDRNMTIRAQILGVISP